MRFGLQATPVRPMPPDHRNWNISYTIKDELYQHWPGISHTRWFSIPNPQNPGEYRDFIENIQNQGVGFIPYSCFSHIDTPLIEEYSQYSENWDTKVWKGFDISHMGMYSCPMCSRQPDFQAFWCYQLKRYLDRYDIDGFYFDCTNPRICKNPGHGHTNCYYFDKNGTRRYEHQIFAFRELMRKMYAIIKRDNPENIIINHCSASFFVPILSFGDALLDGEHFRGSWFDGNYTRFLTDDVRIAEFCGDQLGIECIWLPEYTAINSAWNTPEKARTMMGILLLHDTRVWVAWMHALTARKILRAVKEFDIIDTEFVGFFHDDPLAETTSKNIRASGYRRENELLLVVMNFSNTRMSGEWATLNYTNAGFSPGDSLIAVNQESDSTIALSAIGKITLDIPPKDFRLIHITRHTVVGVDNETPEEFSFDNPSPNPFNPVTKLTFSLPESGDVSCVVFNTLGQKTRILAGGQFEKGLHNIFWDGEDDQGNMVTSGLYFIDLRWKNRRLVRKALVLR